MATTRDTKFLRSLLAGAVCVGTALIITSGPEAAPVGLRLYVAPNGNDHASGTLAAPFATVERARQAIAARNAGGPATVEIRGGTYRLAQPLVFNGADSGSPGHPVTYEAYHGETPIFTGDRAITPKWRAYKGRILMTHLDSVAQGTWNFNRLFVNGQPVERARTPARGSYFHIVPFDAAHPVPNGQAHTTQSFYYHPGDVDPNWTNVGDIEVSSFKRFANPRGKLESIDGSRQIVTLKSLAPSRIPGDGAYFGYDYAGADAYFLDNVFEALAPGSWYLNRHTGDLYYWPKLGENASKETFAAPAISQILSVQGTVNAPVHDLVFRGLTFQHTTFPLPDTGYPGVVLGNDFPDPPAVSVSQASRVAFLGNTIHDVTGDGYKQDQTDTSRIQGNLLYNTGANGIQLSTPLPYQAATSLAGKTANTVLDNTIHDVGQTYAEAPGIMGYAQTNTQIAHNTVYNTGYAGIFLKGGDSSDIAYDNVIEDNLVHDAMQKLDDGGGIYLLSFNSHTTIRGNVIHDVGARGRFFRCGVYLDDIVNDCAVTDNQIYRCLVGVMIHDNHRNTLSNNVLVDNSYMQAALETSPDQTVSHNVFYLGNLLPPPHAFSDPSRYAIGYVSRQNSASDYNLFFNPARASSWEPPIQEWQKDGNDPHGLTADPQFMDYAHDDFRLKPSSPALVLGFHPFGLSAVGPRAPWRR